MEVGNWKFKFRNLISGRATCFSNLFKIAGLINHDVTKDRNIAWLSLQWKKLRISRILVVIKKSYQMTTFFIQNEDWEKNGIIFSENFIFLNKWNCHLMIFWWWLETERMKAREKKNQKTRAQKKSVYEFFDVIPQNQPECWDT